MTLLPPDVPGDPEGGGESISAARSAPVGTSKAAEVAAMEVKTGVQQERLGNEAEAAQREQQSGEELAACELLSLAPETAWACRPTQQPRGAPWPEYVAIGNAGAPKCKFGQNCLN